MRFPTYVTGSTLAEIAKIENARISNKNDVYRRSDHEVRRVGKTRHRVKSDWLFLCFTFVTKSPGLQYTHCLFFRKDGILVTSMIARATSCFIVRRDSVNYEYQHFSVNIQI